MDILILIEPVEKGGFRACAGEPFAVCADGQTENEATQRLLALLRDRLRSGARLTAVTLEESSGTPLHLDPLPDDDWFFQTMREAVAANRQREDEAEG